MVEVVAEVKDISQIFSQTKSKLILNSISEGKKVFALKLPKFKGLLGFELLPNRRIGTELADLVKKYGLKGLLHSDELPKYGVSEEEVQKVRETLSCTDEDAFIIILVDSEKKAKTVFKQIINRLNEMIYKIPKDTRKANEDGTTSFLRPQPGSARMYPETDLPLIFLDRTVEDYEEYTLIYYKIKHGELRSELKIAKLKDKNIDTYLSLKDKGYFVLDSLDPDFRRVVLNALGYNKEQINNILWSEDPDMFEKYVKLLKPSIIYYLYFMLPSEVEKEFGEEIPVTESFIKEAANLLSSDTITRDALKILLYEHYKTGKSLAEIINEKGLYKISGEDLESRVKELIDKYKDLEKKKLFNKVLGELRIIADPKEIIQILNKYLQ